MKYWQLASGNFYPQKKKFGQYFEIGNHDERLKEALLKGKRKVICVNDTIKVRDFTREKDVINEIFEKKLPEKSSFEM